MPLLDDQEFFEEVEKRMKNLEVLSKNDEGNFREALDDLQTLIQYDSTQAQKDHMLDAVMGYGKEDFVGSTKLGSGTGIILQMPLGQGTESGSIDGNRVNTMNEKMETAAEELQRTVHSFKTPKPAGTTPNPYN